MVKTAIAFLLGCVLCLNLSSLPAHGWWLALLLPLTLWFRKVTLSSFIVGLLWAGFQAQLKLDDRLPEHMAGQDILSSGVIASIPEQHADVLRFDFKPDSSQLPELIRLSWYYPDQTLPDAGEHWQMLLRLKPPSGMKNPGGFDYEKWLFSEGIGATGYIRSSADNRRLKAAPWWHIDHLRQQIQKKLDALLPEAKQLPFIHGLAVGQRDSLSTEHWSVLRQTGTSHLLAISGLHIGLAAAIGFFIFRWLWSIPTSTLSLIPARQIGAIGGFSFALFYALLAGMAIPTQRALIMISTVMLALLLKRPLYPSHILALSLLLVLLFDPLSVLSAGFWLSFAAVALILLTCSGRFPARKGNWALIHLWLAIGLIPLLVLFFGQVSILAPLANLLAVPLVSLLIVPLILAAMLSLPVSDEVSRALLELADLLLGWLWQWLSFLSDLPLAEWQISVLPPHLITAMVVLIVVILLPRGLPAKPLGLLVLVPLCFYQAPRPEHGKLYFSLLDVGQGLAAVVETQSHTLVFDTGPRYSDRFDTGSAVVAPFLQYRGVRQVDKLVVSHGDNDHIGGVAGLKSNIPVQQLISSDISELPGASPCLAGENWEWDGVKFEILSPTPKQSGSDNNRSCVVKVTSTNLSILLPGDIERETEIQLVRQYGSELKADILVVPHHGSRTSSTPVFIDAVAPLYALFPVGYRNRYGFPKNEVVERYQQKGSVILRSDHHGALIFDNEPLPVRSRPDASKLWTAGTTE